MSKWKRNASFISATSALALFAVSGAAFAGDDNYKADADTHAEKVKHEESAVLSKFGVAELNDIENWKIMQGETEIGEIDRLAVDRSTGELLAVVGLKGVVGMNKKEVAVPLSKLELSGDETLSTSLTKDELRMQRDIDPWDGSYSQIIKKTQ